MTRIEKTFEHLKSKNKKALIPYIMAGDPEPNVTVSLMHKLVEHGADIIELGMPFSDPMADGETIALAGERALANGTNTRQAIGMVKEFRKKNKKTPVLLMGYLNPIEIIGQNTFIEMCHNAGVDGLLLVDLPPHEAGNFIEKLKKHQMNSIFLLAPTTLSERREKVLAESSGFIYYVSLKGVTGSSNLNTTEVSKQVKEIKKISQIPVCVGFGIRDASSVRAIGKEADGIIVGSELVKNFANLSPINSDYEKLVDQAISNVILKIDELKQALDSL